LIELGFKPSKEFKEILDFAFDLQLDFHFEKSEIIKKIKEKYINHLKQ
jgi:tRNA nucleotidyltransferase (CCA-adding enzyme)